MLAESSACETAIIFRPWISRKATSMKRVGADMHASGSKTSTDG